VIDRRTSTVWIWLALVSASCATGPAPGRLVDSTNNAVCRPTIADRGHHSLPIACQAEPDTAEQPDDIEQRKKYVQGVLSRSNLAGRRLDRTGSGFFASSDGDVITTISTINGCSLVSVSPMVGEMILATVTATDEAAGLALLHVNMASPGVATLTSSEGAVNRKPIYILGYPVLGSVTTAPALTPVRVLNSQQIATGISATLISGDVRPGYNGGPLLDSGGGVIGVVAPGKTQFYGTTQEPSDSVGLALPSESLLAFLDRTSIPYRTDMQLPPKPPDRLLIDSRPFAAQIGCWQ
jgi:S1-C subfamily serine protease